MAQYTVKAPDGTLITLEGPEGASQEEVIAQAQRLYTAKDAAQEQAQQEQPQQAEQQQPQERGLVDEFGRQLGLTGRAAIQAVSAPVNAVLDAGAAAVNMGADALGSDFRLPLMSQVQEAGLNQMLPQPENTLERGVNIGTQAMTSTAALAKAFPKVAGFANDLFRQIPVSGISGAVSQPAAEVVGDFTGSDLAASVAGIGLSVLAAGGTGKALSKVDPNRTKLFTMDQIKERAGKGYTTMDQQGVFVKPESANTLIKEIRQSLDDNRMVPGSDQGKTLETAIKQAENIIDGQKGNVSFGSIEKIRATLNDLKASSDKDLGRLAGVAVDSLDEYVGNLTGKDLLASKGSLDKAVKSLTDARKDWRNASRAETLDDVLNSAEIRADAPNADQGQLIQRAMTNLAANKKKMRSFTKEEQNIIRSISQSKGVADRALGILGQLNPLIGSAPEVVLAKTGGYAALLNSAPPEIAAIMAATGWSANKAQAYLRQASAENAIKRIASGATRPEVGLSNRGLLSGALGEQQRQGNVSVQGISDSDVQRLLTQ